MLYHTHPPPQHLIFHEHHHQQVTFFQKEFQEYIRTKNILQYKHDT